jgi:LuxR family transcriptional regulator, maltose regulon positive regulatory protein
VLERQPEEVRRLLLRTSVLERVSGPLADLLTGGLGSELILQDLEEANAFVVSLDAGRSWFRYHHLFADLLRLELRRTAPLEVRALHRTAAQWYEQQGYVVDAIRHAQAAHEWEQATRLLADNLVSLSLDGQVATTQALLAAFPADVVSADAQLGALLAVGGVAAAYHRAARGDQFVAGSLDEVAGHLAVAQGESATLPDERRRHFDLLLGVARLTLARRRGDVSRVLDEMHALAAASEAPTASEVALGNDLRAMALMDLGIAELWSSRLSDARRHLEEGLTLARRIERPYVEVGCLGHLAMAANESSFALARTSTPARAARTVLPAALKRRAGGGPTRRSAPAHLEKLEAQRLDLGQYPVQRRLIAQNPREPSLIALGLGAQPPESAEQRRTQDATKADLVAH